MLKVSKFIKIMGSEFVLKNSTIFLCGSKEKNYRTIKKFTFAYPKSTGTYIYYNLHIFKKLHLTKTLRSLQLQNLTPLTISPSVLK